MSFDRGKFSCSLMIPSKSDGASNIPDLSNSLDHADDLRGRKSDILKEKLPKDFVPGLKPKKCTEKPSPIRIKKLSPRMKNIGLDGNDALSQEDESSDEESNSDNELKKKFSLKIEDCEDSDDDFDLNLDYNKESKDFSNSQSKGEEKKEEIKEEEQNKNVLENSLSDSNKSQSKKGSNKIQFKLRNSNKKGIDDFIDNSGLRLTRGSMKKIRRNTVHLSRGQDDFKLGSVSKILKIDMEDIPTIPEEFHKSLNTRSMSCSSRFSFCNSSPLNKKLMGGIGFSPSPGKQIDKESSLYYWSIEKKRTGSIIGFLQVKTMEKQQNEILVEEFKLENEEE